MTSKPFVILVTTSLIHSDSHMFVESLLVCSVFLERHVAPHSAIEIMRLDKLRIDLLQHRVRMDL